MSTTSTPCCAQLRDLGCHAACQPLALDFLSAPDDGTYTVILGMGPGVAVTLSLDLTEGQSPTLPADVLNDAYVFQFYIIGPEGQPLADADGHDCFRIRTVPQWPV